MGANNPARAGQANTNRNAKEGNPRYERFTRGNRGLAPLGAAGPELLIDAIDAVTRMGDLISFGRTSDGGAWVISVFSNGQRYPQYAHDAAEIQSVLTELVESCG